MTDQASRLATALADRYRIERELGQGGMATVYLAHDVKHDRKVALKVLRPELAAVIGAQRFLAEIKTTANLQHPHILPLHDSGEVAGTVFYVMPFVEGESLRERLAREKQLPVADALRIAGEVADALEYAHAHGVIHRDIKPENILLHDGHALVADFGIALAASTTGGTRMTETGMSLGTPAYMSPEQAMGERELDARTDIYALGSVLYEMLVGDPPHTGSTAQAIVAKILTEKPASIVARRDRVPAHVEAAVFTALEKLPADRFGSAKAFAEALADPAVSARMAVTAGRPGRPRSWLSDPRSLGVSAVALAATAGLVWSMSARTSSPAGPAVYDVVLPDSAPVALTQQEPVAVAPDGDFVVYQASEAGGSALWYRSLRDATARRIDGTEQAMRPAISPDGSRLAFLRFRSPPKWTLEVAPVSGGAAATLGEGSGEANLQWLEDGRLQVVGGDGNRARWFDPGGGPAVDQQIAYCILPTYLGRGNRFLCGGGGEMWAGVADLRDTVGNKVPLWTRASDSTFVVGSDFRVIDGRYLAYLSLGGDLLAAPVDLAADRAGRSARLVTGIARSPYFGAGTFAISRSGTLVYATGANRAVGYLVASDGSTFDTLHVAPDGFRVFAVSPDGRRLAAVVDGLQGSELRVYDLRTGEYVTWARRPELRQPVWSPHGDRLLFSVGDSIFVGEPDRTGAPERVATVPGQFEAFAWTARDRVVGGLWSTLTVVSLDLTRTPAALDTLARDASFPTVSPDGRWLAYNDADQTTVWAEPLPMTGQRYQVATGSVTEPQWRSDHELLFLSYRGDEPSMARARLEGTGGAPVFRQSAWMDLPDFMDTPGLSHQLMPDGRLLYVRMVPDVPKRSLRVVPMWTTAMKQAVDAANQ